MSPIVGQRMIRTDDGMRGEVELVQVPGFENEFERRVVYIDRGEKRVAGKREVWEVEKAPPRKLRDEEIMCVAHAADRVLRSLDKNEPILWWRTHLAPRDEQYDPELVSLIVGYLIKRR